MTVKEIIIEKLTELGADGLCYENCGCGIDDLIPCSKSIEDCVPAKLKKADEQEYRYLKTGNEIYVPL